jgi:transposase
VIRAAKEASMPGAYPVELRERVVAAYENGEGTYEELAERFVVGRASVSRWIALARYNAGSLEPKPMGGARHALKVQGDGEALVRELLQVMPDSTLAELVRTFKEERGIEMHRSTMGRCVARMKFTKKKRR